MKLNFKIMALVIMVTGIMVLSTFAYHFVRSKEEKLFNYAYLQNTTISIQSILNSRQHAIDKSLEDNSAWDMMVDFVRNPDTIWANENIGSSRQTLNLDFIQIYDLDFKKVWAVYNPDLKAGLSRVISENKLQALFSTNPTCHFFEITEEGLLELYGSIIVPSLDIARKTPAHGYLFFGILWKKDAIVELENSSNSFVELQYSEIGKEQQLISTNKKSQTVTVYLKDYSGKNIAMLDFMSKSFYKADTRLFYLFTLIPFILTIVVLVVFYLMVRKLITMPVRNITYSLDKQDPGSLKHIPPSNHEFYAIARLVAESFENKKILEKEIAERKKAEERIIEYAEDLKEINISKDKFFSILAHDLKSPFHYLLGYSDLLKNEYPTMNDEERKKFISVIHSNSQRLYNLLENLLAWSRLQTGRIDFEMEVFDLCREVKQICETVGGSATYKHIRLKTAIPEVAIIKADRNMVRSVVQNILSNAIKFTPENGSVSIKVDVDESNVEVYFIDTGIGMTQGEITKLFRIDVSFSRPGTNKEPGTGLGLILAKEFIEKNGGRIFVESEVEKGSIFKFTLPLHKA